MIATVLAGLLAAAGFPAAADDPLASQVAVIFSPYSQDEPTLASWERPIWSAEVNALIAHWLRVAPEDEPDEMNDGDWLCQCQDWDARGFSTEILSQQKLSDERVEIHVGIDLGFGDWSGIRDARLVFAREGEAWKLDDILAEDAYPQGLKQQLRLTISADEARAAEAKQ